MPIFHNHSVSKSLPNNLAKNKNQKSPVQTDQKHPYPASERHHNYTSFVYTQRSVELQKIAGVSGKQTNFYAMNSMQADFLR
jgi:hypothetical protein